MPLYNNDSHIDTVTKSDGVYIRKRGNENGVWMPISRLFKGLISIPNSNPITMVSAASYNAQPTDTVIMPTQNTEIFLFDAVLVNGGGAFLTVKNNATTVVRITPRAGETIDGSDFIELTQPFVAVKLQVYENGKWAII